MDKVEKELRDRVMSEVLDNGGPVEKMVQYVRELSPEAWARIRIILEEPDGKPE